MDATPLSGTVALVTGASSGIGAATGRRLAAEGAAVALVADRRDRLNRLVADLGGRAEAFEADITDPEQAYQAVLDTVERFQRLDMLVNNAGVMLLGTALHATLDEWDRMVALNVRALLHVTHAAVPYLIDAASTSERQVADIVNIGSTSGRVAQPATSVYNLTRFGLNGFTEALRQELRGERVRVSVVEPGTAPTELAGHLDDDIRETALGQISDLEPLPPTDVADAVAYIVLRGRRVAVNQIMLRAADQTW
ncbi:SDR family NAD(P)-dependent oxidoreductase [Actinoplanes sp. TRM 88003]|uniref:SDR family NAD(P)-dependent oxidoreductase n=1 Tax=Paractinoplanes aksuensis TaxID=2939490 RepID=A0ABT1DQX9_9ACTN|nr:SDR family NAD(P)-dependent oxidoreductase [Actinoplanes aksuensis]MCO8273252.1 SDR family NAD(P)-dependent oxidoreductase [Actinoplanes aksuensis]